MKHDEARRAIAALVVGALALGFLAWFDGISGGKHSPHDVWPIHSAYALPLMLMACAWIALGCALIVLVIWLCIGSDDD